MNSFAIFLLSAFSLVFMIGVFGNALVWFVLRRYRKPNSFERMTCYLAFIDMLTSFINPPLFMYWEIVDYSVWDFGDVLCNILPSLNMISNNISIMFIIVITVDRCRSIAFPFKGHFSKRQLHAIVAIVIVASFLLEVPYIIQLKNLSSVSATVTCFNNNNNNNNDFKRYVHDVVQGGARNNTQQNSSHFFKQESIKIYNIYCHQNITAEKLPYLDTNPDFSQPSNTTCRITECHNLPSFCTVYLSKYFKPIQIVEIAIMVFKIACFMFIFIISNVVIYNDIQRNHRKASKTSLPGLRSKKIYLILTWMTVVFSLLVFPKDIFYVFYGCMQFTNLSIEFRFANEINAILKLLQISNCCANMFIYAKLHTKFRRGVTELSKSIIKESGEKVNFSAELRKPSGKKSCKEKLLKNV